MLNRIKELLKDDETFAFETTLASRTFVKFIEDAKRKGYETTILFLWLSNVELAIERVKIRVTEGGHNIPEETIIRRYNRGLSNFFKLFKQKIDNWIFVNNSGTEYKLIATGSNTEEIIFDEEIWQKVKDKYER